jgi:hypothetical protein
MKEADALPTMLSVQLTPAAPSRHFARELCLYRIVNLVDADVARKNPRVTPGGLPSAAVTRLGYCGRNAHR